MIINESLTYNFHMRWMIRRDMNEVIPILRYTNGPTEDELVEMLRVNGCIGMVIEADEQIVAVVVYYLRRQRLDVKCIKIHPEWTDAMDRYGNTLYKVIYNKLESKLSFARRTEVHFLLSDDYSDWHTFIQLCKVGCTGRKYNNKWLAKIKYVAQPVDNVDVYE